MPKKRLLSMKIAERLGQLGEMRTDTGVSKLWLCQVIAHDLKSEGHQLNGLRFSKVCGYDFDITK